MAKSEPCGAARPPCPPPVAPWLPACSACRAPPPGLAPCAPSGAHRPNRCLGGSARPRQGRLQVVPQAHRPAGLRRQAARWASERSGLRVRRWRQRAAALPSRQAALSAPPRAAPRPSRQATPSAPPRAAPQVWERGKAWWARAEPSPRPAASQAGARSGPHPSRAGSQARRPVVPWALGQAAPSAGRQAAPQPSRRAAPWAPALAAPSAQPRAGPPSQRQAVPWPPRPVGPSQRRLAGSPARRQAEPPRPATPWPPRPATPWPPRQRRLVGPPSRPPAGPPRQAGPPRLAGRRAAGCQGPRRWRVPGSGRDEGGTGGHATSMRPGRRPGLGRPGLGRPGLGRRGRRDRVAGWRRPNPARPPQRASRGPVPGRWGRGVPRRPASRRPGRLGPGRPPRGRRERR